MSVPVLITPPPVEPITLADVKLQLGFGPMENSDHVRERQLSEQLRPMIAAARAEAEGYLRRALITQTWLYLRDGFAGFDPNYTHHGYAAVWIPKPPFQSMAVFQYVDVSGALQSLAVDTTYGVNPVGLNGYQIVTGSDTMPASVMPPFSQPWPPVRRVPSNVRMQFKCGYGGPVVGSMTSTSAVLTGPVFLPGDVGQSISVPGAGDSGATLATTIASVDVNGQATLSAAATTAVASVSVWAGQQVPPEIRQGLKLLVEYYHGGGREPLLRETALRQMETYRNFIC